MNSVAILAGGMGRRLGRPKIYLKCGERYLYEVLHERLSVVSREVFIVLSEGISLPRKKPGLSLLYDDEKYPDRGPLAGIYTALEACEGDTLFVCAVDMPFVSGELAGYLVSSLLKKGIEAVIPVVGGKVHPLCATYAKGSGEKIEGMLNGGVRMVSRVVDYLSTCLVRGDALKSAGIPEKALFNINTLEDIRDCRDVILLECEDP